MSFALSILGHGRPLRMAEGETVLAAALAAGIAYPHGCRSGNCGSCKSHLHAGSVAMLPYSAYALSAAEQARGLILACRAQARSDIAVSWLEGDDLAQHHPLRRLACRVLELADLTHDIRRVRLAILSGGPLAFSAGQYASITFPGQAPRDYSMANPPGTLPLEFHIRRMAGGGASAYVAGQLSPGDAVTLEGPFGAAYFRPGHGGPMLALAGGSGLAPIKAIVETALGAGAKQPIALYFGARDERDLYLEDHFAALAARHANFRFVPVLSAPSRPTARRAGLLHEAVAADHAALAGWQAYLAGPPALVEAAGALLAARGIAPEDIHADPFYTEAEKAALAAPA